MANDKIRELVDTLLDSTLNAITKDIEAETSQDGKIFLTTWKAILELTQVMSKIERRLNDLETRLKQ